MEDYDSNIKPSTSNRWEYGMQTNLEIKKELKGENIISKIQEQWLRRLTLIWRVSTENIINVIMDPDQRG